jgi:catechol 2,3-dioxygenase-like lactoylglutathione lyase family enzyme
MYIGSTVLNVGDLERGIAFWTAALGYVLRDPTHGPDFAVLRDPSREWSNLSLQLSGDPKRGVNRLHLDLYTDDQPREVERLLSIGATRVEPWPYEPDDDFVVLADPAGNEFCVVQHT